MIHYTPSVMVSPSRAWRKNGAYYGPTEFGDTRGPVGESKISDAARDEAAAARLWTISEELLGITWNIA